MKIFFILLTVLLCFAQCKKTQDKTVDQGVDGFVSKDVVPVTDAIVLNCFNSVGKNNVHPRLLFSEADILKIKTTALSDQFAKATYDNIISTANNVLSTPLLDYGLDGAGLRISNIHKISNNQVPYLVLAYQFTKDPKYALRCWQQLEKMCSWPDWGAYRHFLDAGIAAKGIAIAYDGLYNYLTVEQRSVLAAAVKKFVLEPAKTQIQTGTGPFKWWLTNDNWNGICHGGMIMAALAIYETDPTYNSKIISIAVNGILPYMQSLAPDGASEEGMSYWSYGLSNTFLAFESMKRCLSTTYGLAEQAGFRKTGWFPYLVSGPVGTASFGDDYTYIGKNYKFLSYFWFSNYFKDAALAKAHYDNCIARNSNKNEKMNGWSDLLFYNHDLVSQGSSTVFPLSNYTKVIDYMYVQEDNTDNAMYIGMHGGDNNASHGHLDAGTFFIQALGENFAVGNLGSESPYQADYFNSSNPTYTSASTTITSTPGRLYYYRVRTESKNCLVFNPDARPEQNPLGAASVAASSADITGGYYVIDLAGCYSKDVSAYKRGIKLNRSTSVITIQDEFTPKTSSTVYWLMQSLATDGLIISADGKTATMIKNGKTLYAVIQSPSNAMFQKVDRSTNQINYLTETAPIFSPVMTGKNSSNQYYGKLQIKLTGVAAIATTIRVDFVKSATSPTTPLIALNAWTTGN